MPQDDQFKYKFVWEKWNTPEEEYRESLLYQQEEPAEEIDPEEMEEVLEEAYSQEIYIQNKLPMQLVHSFIEQNKFQNSFEFWTLHTNFDLTDEVSDVIQSTAGVENFQKVTRYRAKIGLTKAGLFDNRKVKRDIQENIKLYLIESSLENTQIFEEEDMLEYFDESTKSTIEEAREKLSLSSHMWSIFVFPNGELSTFEYSSEQEMLEKISFLAQVKSVLGGYILCSDPDFGV